MLCHPPHVHDEAYGTFGATPGPVTKSAASSIGKGGGAPHPDKKEASSKMATLS